MDFALIAVQNYKRQLCGVENQFYLNEMAMFIPDWADKELARKKKYTDEEIAEARVMPYQFTEQQLEKAEVKVSRETITIARIKHGKKTRNR